MTAGLVSFKNVLTPSAKSTLVSLGLTTADSATDAAIQKIIFGTARTLVLSNETWMILWKELSLWKMLVCWQKVPLKILKIR